MYSHRDGWGGSTMSLTNSEGQSRQGGGRMVLQIVILLLAEVLDNIPLSV